MGDEDEVNIYDGILPCQGRQGGMYPQVHIYIILMYTVHYIYIVEGSFNVRNFVSSLRKCFTTVPFTFLIDLKLERYR